MPSDKVVRVSSVFRHLRLLPLLLIPSIGMVIASAAGMDTLWCRYFAKACALDYSLTHMAVLWGLAGGAIVVMLWPIALASTAEIYERRVRVGLLGISTEIHAEEVVDLRVYNAGAHYWDFGNESKTIRLYVGMFDDSEVWKQRVVGWYEANRLKTLP